MRVHDARILGFLAGLVLGGFFAPYIEVIVLMIAAIGVIQIFTKRQILKGPLGGLLVGIAAGYFLRELMMPYIA